MACDPLIRLFNEDDEDNSCVLADSFAIHPCLILLDVTKPEMNERY